MTDDLLTARQIVEIADWLQSQIAENPDPFTATYQYPRFVVVIDYAVDDCLTLLFEPKNKFDESFSPILMLKALLDLKEAIGAFDDVDPTVENFLFGYLYSEEEIPKFSSKAVQNYAEFLVRHYQAHIETAVPFFGQYHVVSDLS